MQGVRHTQMFEPQAEQAKPPQRFWVRLAVALVAAVTFAVVFKRAADPGKQIQAVLDAETKARNGGDWQTFEALQDRDDETFWNHQKATFDGYQRAREAGDAVMPASTLQITEIGRWEDQAWAKVTETTAEQAAPPRIEFFRLVYGEWLHTGPAPAHWGQPLETRTEHLMWQYRESDRGWVTSLGARAETIYQRVCNDLALDPQARVLTVEVCYAIDCDSWNSYPPDPLFRLPTLLLAGYREENADHLIASWLVSYLVDEAARGSDENLVDSRLLAGIRYWEAEQVGDEPLRRRLLSDLTEAVAEGNLLSLDKLSQPFEAETAALIYAEAYTVVQYAVAEYGSDILPSLARAAGRRVGVGETLKEVLGPDLDLVAFEADWLAFVREQYGWQ